MTLGEISPIVAVMQLLSDIEAFVAAHEITERKFGELALNDKNFVSDVRDGRSPSLKTVSRIRQFMMTYRADTAA